MPDFKLPDLGEGVTEAEVDRWLVKEGDTVAEDDPLVELITDKATAEIPSPFAGLVTRIHVAEGTTVPVGTVLISIGDDAGGPGISVEAVAQPSTQATPATGLSIGAEAPIDGAVAADDIKAMPPVRKLARELDIDLSKVTGSGPSGRILRQDVEAHAARNAGTLQDTSVRTMPPPPPPPGEVSGEQAPPDQGPREQGQAGMRSPEVVAGRSEPFRGIRRKIAERMSDAHRIVPPVTHVEECDVTELDATRKLANDRNPDQQRLTYLPFILKAVVTGLRDHPVINASLDEEASEIVFHDRYDIGVAVDTPGGLVVPVVREVDKKRLREIGREIEQLANAARSGTLKSQELQGGTFTVTSPGPYGGLMATPIVFHPQAAILGVHRAIDRAVVREGQIVIRKMMNLSITFDHRILDGVSAARFLLDVVKLLEHPAVLALES